MVSHQKRVSPEHALGQRLLLRPDREHDLVRRRELLRNLKAGVAAADHESCSRWHVTRPAVADGMGLEEIGGELLAELRHICGLERTRRDNDLVGDDRPSSESKPEAVVAPVELLDLAVQLDRQLEGLGVALEVGDHLVPSRVAVRDTGKLKAWERAVATGCEER